jgi:hypothetical protein
MTSMVESCLYVGKRVILHEHGYPYNLSPYLGIDENFLLGWYLSVLS